MGGHLKNPTYEDVCRGDSGHTEVVEVVYDPKLISYQELLDLFWRIHDPTTLNRQGPDIGYQYRSVIFYHTLEQKLEAQESLKKIQSSNKGREIVTALEPATTFYRAEEYHQQYLEKTGGKSCHFF